MSRFHPQGRRQIDRSFLFLLSFVVNVFNTTLPDPSIIHRSIQPPDPEIGSPFLRNNDRKSVKVKEASNREILEDLSMFSPSGNPSDSKLIEISRSCVHRLSVKSNFSPRLLYTSSECAFRSIGYNYRFVRFYETVIPIFPSLFPFNLRWKRTFFASVVTFWFLPLSLSFSFLIFFFSLCIYFFFIPSLPLSLNFFPSIIRSVGKWRESMERRDERTRGEKISSPLSGKRIDYVRGSCLTRSISSIGHRFDPRSRWHDDETKIDERSFFLVREKFRNLIGMILRFQVCYNDSNKGLINRIEYVMK